MDIIPGFLFSIPVQRDVSQGHLAVELIHDHEIISQLASTLCATAKETRQLQRWLLSSFPDTAAEYLFPEMGKLVEPLGDALLVHACAPIYRYEIFWNQTYNGTCYSTFPTVSQDLPGTYFLDLAKRRLYSDGHRIDCNKRGKRTYIADSLGVLWEYSNASFRKIRSRLWSPLNGKTSLLKIAHFDLRLLHYDKKVLPRSTLLSLLAHHKRTLDTLQGYIDSGNGDLIMGIGTALGNTLSSIAHGSSQIIRSLGAGIRDTLIGVANVDKSVINSIGNATSSVIDSSTTGISKIFSSLGGLGNVILWALVILLYIYEVIKQRPDVLLHRYFFQRPPVPPPRQNLPPPEMLKLPSVPPHAPQFSNTTKCAHL